MSVSSTPSSGVVSAFVFSSAVVEPAAACVVEPAAACVVEPAAAAVVLAEIVGAVTAHGLSTVHMVLSEAVNPSFFETKSVTSEERSEALPAKIAVT